MLQYIGFSILMIGLFFISSGILGVLRFHKSFTKLHASGIIECFGVPLSLIGLSFLQSTFSSSFKLLLNVLIILLLSPVSSICIAQAARFYNDKN